jgi:DNA (cytosine-5)-methyltransferase 1
MGYWENRTLGGRYARCFTDHAHRPSLRAEPYGGRLRLAPYVPSHEIIDWSRPLPSIFSRKKDLAPATMRRIAVGLRRYVLGDPHPFLLHLTHSGTRAVHPVTGPLPTLTAAHRGELALCTPKLVRLAGETVSQEDAIIAPWIVMHNLGMVGHPVTATLPTLTTAGTQVQLAAAFLVKLRGTSTVVSIRDPLPTFSAGGNHIAAVAAMLERVSPELVARDEFGALKPLTVTINGDTYAIVDIGMRMLEPDEAARAHELELPSRININGVSRALTKTEAMRLIGNSVPKRMARLLAEANQAHRLYLPSSAMMAAD